MEALEPHRDMGSSSPNHMRQEHHAVPKINRQIGDLELSPTDLIRRAICRAGLQSARSLGANFGQRYLKQLSVRKLVCYHGKITWRRLFHGLATRGQSGRAQQSMDAGHFWVGNLRRMSRVVTAQPELHISRRVEGFVQSLPIWAHDTPLTVKFLHRQ